THPHQPEHLEEVWMMALDFWQNLQFDLVLLATMVVIVWALIRPGALKGRRPYAWAAVFLALLALSPLLALSDGLVRPLAKSQYVARTVNGLIIGAWVLVMLTHRSPLAARVPALATLKLPPVGRRFLSFAFVMLLAGVPADVYLTQSWANYLDVMRT